MLLKAAQLELESMEIARPRAQRTVRAVASPEIQWQLSVRDIAVAETTTGDRSIVMQLELSVAPRTETPSFSMRMKHVAVGVLDASHRLGDPGANPQDLARAALQEFPSWVGGELNRQVFDAARLLDVQLGRGAADQFATLCTNLAAKLQVEPES